MKETHITASNSATSYWLDLWDYRELFCFLSWRDMLVRYKQTCAGALWAVIRPLLTMAVLTVVFGHIARLSSNHIPYPLLVLSGLIPWSFFATAFSECGNSLVNNSGMVSKVYFPRLIIPTSCVATCFVEFFISLALLALMMGWYGHPPPPQVWVLPLFVVLAAATALSAGIWVAALMVRYRDFRYIIPFVIQFGLYASPVGFSSSAVPPSLRWIHDANPMTGIINGFRWCLLKDQPLDPQPIACAALAITATLATGVWFFRNTESSFADII